MLLRPSHSVPVQSKCQGWAAQGLGVAFYWWQSHVVICCDIWLWDVMGCYGMLWVLRRCVGVHPVMLAERDAVPARPSTLRMDVLRLCPGHLLTVLTVFPPILDAKSPDLLGNSCCTGCCGGVLVIPALFTWYGIRMHTESFWEVYVTWRCPRNFFQLHRMCWQSCSGGFLFLSQAEVVLILWLLLWCQSM